MALLSDLPCRFGKFVLIDRIGRGGMADVFRGMLQGADGFTKECAVKVILPSLAEDPHFVRMFIDEARVAVWLNHPNVVQIYDLGQVEGQYFIAMEYVSGKDLLDLLAARARTKLRIPVAAAVYIAIEVLRGLDFAHHATSPIGEPLTIVHRDVSPSNILLSYQGLVKVADFGIAKSGLQSNLTEGGTHKGKMGYMSPEQVTGHEVDLRSDLFGAGVVLFEMLTMSRLFKAPTDLDVMLKIRDVNITEELTRLRDVPIELRDILLRALSKVPQQRFATGGEFADALQAFADRDGLELGPHLLAKVLQDTFAESVVAEAKRRQTSQEVLPAPVPAPAAPTFRFRDAQGQVHGPMALPELHRLLTATPHSVHERVSVSGGLWLTTEVFPTLADIPRGVEPTLVGEPENHPSLNSLHQVGPLNRDWEDLALAGFNPKRAKKGRATSASGSFPAADAATGSGDAPALELEPPPVAHNPFPARDSLEGSTRETLRGSLSSGSIVQLLHAIHAHKLTGRLRLWQGDRTIAMHARSGALVVIDTESPDARFGGYLVDRDLISPEQLSYGLVRAARYGGQLGHTLVSEGVISPHTLFTALCDRLREDIFSLIGVSEGIWVWEPDRQDAGNAMEAGFELDQLIATGVKERCSLSYLRSYVSELEDHPLEPTTTDGTFGGVRVFGRALRLAMNIGNRESIGDLLRRFTADGWSELEVRQILFWLVEREAFRFVGVPSSLRILTGR